MAKSTLSAREFIQKSFSPCVAVLSSPLVDEICQKNDLSFIELLDPFCALNKDVSYKDPSGTIITVHNLQVNLFDIHSKPPEAAVARRLLNESVATDTNRNIESTTIKSGSISVQIPSSVTWFEKWRETFLRVQFPSDHEFTKHYVACMIVITSKDDSPMDTLSNMVQQFQQMLNMSPPKMMPKWFSSSILRYYVLLHDTVAGDIKKAERVFEEMKSTYNANCCYLLQINSRETGVAEAELLSHWKKFGEILATEEIGVDVNMTDSFTSRNSDSTRVETGLEISEHSKSEILVHPLSPQLESQQMLESQRMFNNDTVVDAKDIVDGESRYQHPAACLSPDDVAHIRTLMSSFIMSALIPFVETQMQYLNEMVVNKKGVSKSLFSATKRWFGGPKPGSPMSVPNAHYYHPDSPELQMRRLGDLCFMFCAYSSAFQAYHSVKRDFSADGAWLYYAGALEMAALSAFLIGQDIKKAMEYTEEGVVTYLQICRMPQFATRLTLCATECLKNLNMFGEAAGRLLQMTSEESDLRSALLLEEASYCFVKSRKPCMPRKYAFHLVLAGHRFSKAGQKKHSLRCYRQAYQVYEDKNWCLAEDHIHFTIGKLALALKQKEVTAAEFAKLFERPSTQLPAQQANFLKEYFLSLIELQKENNDSLPYLQVPHVDHSTIKIALNTFENEDIGEGYVLANKQMSEEELSDKRWFKLEESLVSYGNNNVLPVMFKPTISIFSDFTNNSNKPTCIVGERIRTSVDLVNVLNIPFTLKMVKLIWVHSARTEDPSVDENSLGESEVIETLSLDPDSRNKISLHITPKIAGEIRISGIMYTVVLQPASEGAESISITGHTVFKPKGMRVVSKDRNPIPEYLPDHRLQLLAVTNAPRLKIYLKNIPTEMLCGEVKEVPVLLQNVGTLPIKRVFFTSSEPSLFSVPQCKVGSKVFPLQCQPIGPGHSIEVTIFLRGCEKSGRISIDLLFYYDAEKSSPQKLKYRLLYHTMHLLVHESLYSSVVASRSMLINDDAKEVINIQIQVQNKNQVYDSVDTTIFLHQISLFSSSWVLRDVIFSTEGKAISLEREQVSFITLRAERKKKSDSYSDLILCSSYEGISSVSKPFCDFTAFVIDKLMKNEAGNLAKDSNNQIVSDESPISINSILILFWKAEVKINDQMTTAVGQHHLPLLKLGQKYTSDVDGLNQVDPVISSPSVFIPSSSYYNSLSVNEFVVTKMKHPSCVSHSFSLNRICCVPVELFVQNCCDHSVVVKLDTTYHANNNLSKINESAMFLWLGLVLHTFVLQEHSAVKIPLTLCVGNTGTYDLGTQFNVLARKNDTDDVFVAQLSIPHSLLSVTNNGL